MWYHSKHTVNERRCGSIGVCSDGGFNDNCSDIFDRADLRRTPQPLCHHSLCNFRCSSMVQGSLLHFGAIPRIYIWNICRDSIYNIRIESIITRPLQGLKTAFFAEFMATFIIMFLAALISCAPHARTGQVAGFAMGVAIALAILVTGPVSGGSMNPARSIGPALISWNFEGIWLYILAPTVGAVLGAFVARMLRLQRRSCSRDSSPNAGLICQVNH
ncbi:hypothetical protein Scep_009340 [Stephania cephalantha]|uniref:Aquaporin n=1 Tax=Stephania cephalantha TaxID=152367 RepID=A0AAP0PE81_9MAGN